MFFKARSQPPDDAKIEFNSTLGNMIFEQIPTTKGARNWICVPDYKNNTSYGMGILANLTGNIVP